MVCEPDLLSYILELELLQTAELPVRFAFEGKEGRVDHMGSSSSSHGPLQRRAAAQSCPQDRKATEVRQMPMLAGTILRTNSSLKRNTGSRTLCSAQNTGDRLPPRRLPRPRTETTNLERSIYKQWVAVDRRGQAPRTSPPHQLPKTNLRCGQAMVILNLMDRRSRRKGSEYSGSPERVILGSVDRMIDTMGESGGSLGRSIHPSSRHLDAPKHAEESWEQIRG